MDTSCFVPNSPTDFFSSPSRNYINHVSVFFKYRIQHDSPEFSDGFLVLRSWPTSSFVGFRVPRACCLSFGTSMRTSRAGRCSGVLNRVLQIRWYQILPPRIKRPTGQNPGSLWIFILDGINILSISICQYMSINIDIPIPNSILDGMNIELLAQQIPKPKWVYEFQGIMAPAL